MYVHHVCAVLLEVRRDLLIGSNCTSSGNQTQALMKSNKGSNYRPIFLHHVQTFLIVFIVKHHDIAIMCTGFLLFKHIINLEMTCVYRKMCKGPT